MLNIPLTAGKNVWHSEDGAYFIIYATRLASSLKMEAAI